MKVRCYWMLFVAILGLASGCPKSSPDRPTDPAENVNVDLSELARQRNLGLAYLENEELTQSLFTFKELQGQLPGELMCARNIAVSAVLNLTKVNRSEAKFFEEAKNSFRVSILELKEQDSSEVPYLLSAQGLVALQDAASAMKELETAVEIAPDNPTAWFMLFNTSKLSNADGAKESGVRALKKGYQLAPQNLATLIDLLQALGEAEDDYLFEVIDSSEDLLDNLAPGLKKRVRIDIRDLVKSAKEAAAGGDWATAKNKTRGLRNVVISDDAAQSDRQRIEKHPLEYVIEDFSKPLEQKIAEAQRSRVSPIEVRFLSETIMQDDVEFHDAQFADFDLNQSVELCVLQEGLLKVLSPTDDWKEVTQINVPQGQSSLTIADLENDKDDSLIPEGQKDKVCHTADLEVIAYGVTGVSLFQSQLTQVGGELSFKQFDLEGGLTDLKNLSQISCSDVNNDGDLDLVIIADGKLSLWSNRGNLQYEEIAGTWELAEDVLQVSAVDYDHDVDTDLIVLLKSGEIGYLENLRHSTFRWQAITGQPISFQPAMFDVLDFNRDGEWDFFVAGEEQTAIFAPAKGSEQSELKLIPVAPGRLQGVTNWDYDLDGYRDFILLTDQSLTIQQGRGTAEQGDSTIEKDLAIGSELRRSDTADVDADGDDDIIVLGTNGLLLVTNDGGNQNNYIDIELLAEQLASGGASSSGRVNQYGIGSIIEVRNGVNYQKQLVTKQKTRFGLGQDKQADAIRVLWTNGVPANVLEPAANQLVCERQSLKGSCPYLYAWNGENFDFVTDLLWASPIGLQDARGELVPARNWEYLKIPGEKLVAQDGEYRLSITEELWEVAYFDYCELIAIDHPADVEIYSNEKVGPPTIAEYKIHSTQTEKKHYPISAVNHSGRDLLSEISHQDEIYAKPFDQKMMQGYVEESWLELDLGVTEKPHDLKLFLTGWIYPTDTSINAALQENPALPGPRPPSLLVPDESGEFKEVVPFTGFPGGKTKTIVLELNDIFLTDDYRLRLATSSEIYWDEIFFTVADASYRKESEVVQTPLTLSSAVLQYRGVSKTIEHPQFGPESYDYQTLQSMPPWPAISGNFTRFGDVQQLIQTADDRMVIMGTGDEMVLSFTVPSSPLPTDWKRDFILHNVGWDKDADLHTVYGTHVEPLPFRIMRKYPYLPDEEFPALIDSSSFHTRQINPLKYRNAVRHPVLSQ